jgi:succinylarginine dihydrolase
MTDAFEINFDGIVGPTHNYAGLSPGNIAAEKNALTVSNPKQAALQGLAKMKFLHDLGIRQAVLPPHPRPDLTTLRRLGFNGSDAEILRDAHRHDPRLLAAVYSASAMWAANAATISPSADAADHRVHFTPANLITQFHRSLEAPVTVALLKSIFPSDDFVHHDPLPAADAFGDEGAANHMRLCDRYGEAGIEIFVYGRSAERSVTRFPARQSFDACAAVARRHQLNPQQVIFARQSPQAIDAGVFHNDVVAVSNRDVLLCHAGAYADGQDVISEIRRKFKAISGRDPFIFVADENELSLADAVESYVFNSQIVTHGDGKMSLIAPIECRDHPRVQNFLRRVLNGKSPIQNVHYLDVRQSMNNGGGPACLRLRVVLTEAQLRKVSPGVIFNENLHGHLTAWVGRHYRESLSPNDLADPSLLTESRAALDELLQLLELDQPHTRR